MTVSRRGVLRRPAGPGSDPFSGLATVPHGGQESPYQALLLREFNLKQLVPGVSGCRELTLRKAL